MTPNEDALRCAAQFEDDYWPEDDMPLEAAAHLRRLVAENEALRLDAARWRYARENPRMMLERWENVPLAPEECDRAADDEMRV